MTLLAESAETPVLNWFAIKTTTHEKTVAEALEAKGFEHLLPLYTTRKQWSDRTKEVQVPFFPGYLFSRFDVTRRMPILTTYGVGFIVGSGKIPVPIPDEEIEALKLIVESGLPAGPHPYLQVGQQVEIVKGPLRGVEGLLVGIKNGWRVVVSVTLLQRSVAVEVDRYWVKLISPSKPAFENRKAC